MRVQVRSLPTLFAGFVVLVALGAAVPKVTRERFDDNGFTPIFDGKSLTGWHVSSKTGHGTGGKWVVQDGTIVGSQDKPGNGGIVITDAPFQDFEVALEMNNDYGPDSGLFLRSTENGHAYQAMIDYHPAGNLMGVYGEGIPGVPETRNFDFVDKPSEIKARTTAAYPLPFDPSQWPEIWHHGQWNELRARIVGNPPKVTTWINGVKILEFEDKAVRHPARGGIALQVHGGGDHTKEFVRYRNIRVKVLDK